MGTAMGMQIAKVPQEEPVKKEITEPAMKATDRNRAGVIQLSQTPSRKSAAPMDLVMVLMQ
jgi:hypothetical protein